MISANWGDKAENAFADEVLRVAPRLAAARLNEDPDYLLALWNTLAASAHDAGISDLRMWKIIGVTAMAWQAHLVRQLAIDGNVSYNEAADHLSTLALEAMVGDG